MTTNNFTIEGTLLEKGVTREFTGGSSKTFIILVEDKSYKAEPEFFVLGDNVAKLDSVGLGSLVEVSFSLQGKDIPKKTGGTFHKTELKAWKFNVKEANNTNAPLAPQTGTYTGQTEGPISDTRLLEESANAYAHRDDDDGPGLPF